MSFTPLKVEGKTWILYHLCELLENNKLLLSFIYLAILLGQETTFELPSNDLGRLWGEVGAPLGVVKIRNTRPLDTMNKDAPVAF